MQEKKYIVIKGVDGVENIFIFDKRFNHDDFADMANSVKVRENMDWFCLHGEIVGAGFTDGSACYGESETLGVKSRGESDTKLLKGET